jgi:hypothetical protein
MNDASEVKLHFLDYWRTIRLRAGLIALAFLLVMITASVTVYFLPASICRSHDGSEAGQFNAIEIILDRRVALDRCLSQRSSTSCKDGDSLSRHRKPSSLTPGRQRGGECLNKAFLQTVKVATQECGTRASSRLAPTVLIQKDPNIANTVAIVYQQGGRPILKNMDSGPAVEGRSRKAAQVVDASAAEMSSSRSRWHHRSNPLDFSSTVGRRIVASSYRGDMMSQERPSAGALESNRS